MYIYITYPNIQLKMEISKNVPNGFWSYPQVDLNGHQNVYSHCWGCSQDFSELRENENIYRVIKLVQLTFPCMHHITSSVRFQGPWFSPSNPCPKGTRLSRTHPAPWYLWWVQFSSSLLCPPSGNQEIWRRPLPPKQHGVTKRVWSLSPTTGNNLDFGIDNVVDPKPQTIPKITRNGSSASKKLGFMTWVWPLVHSVDILFSHFGRSEQLKSRVRMIQTDSSLSVMFNL